MQILLLRCLFKHTHSSSEKDLLFCLWEDEKAKKKCVSTPPLIPRTLLKNTIARATGDKVVQGLVVFIRIIFQIVYEVERVRETV